MEISLKGKVAVVTGGTRGIGFAIVKRFVEAGAAVALCGSKESTAQAALERIKMDFPAAQVMALAPDLTSTASVERAFGEVYERFGSLDILANNAGISQRTRVQDYTESEVNSIINLNVKAVFICSRAAAAIMKRCGGGSIISTSSVVSLYGQPSGCLYPASKFAVNGLTKSLARELAPAGIRVNAVAPGVTRTDMVASLPEELIKPLIEKIPLGRMCEPDDIANAYLFLASSLASYITGAVLPVDGAVVI